MSAAFSPPDAWRNAFEQQATPTLTMRLLPLARRCSRRLATSGRVGGELRAQELIQDVLGDTLLGVVRWVPERKTLEAHVADTIRWRTRNECGQATKYVSFDVPSVADDDPGSSGGWADPWRDADEQEGDAAWELKAGAPENDETHEFPLGKRSAEQVFGELRELAQGDREVLQLLRAYEHGARTSADVLAMVSLTTASYRNARVRLSRLAKRCATAPHVPMHRKATTP